MRYGVAKIRQHVITPVMGEIAVKPLYDLRTGLIIGMYDLPQVFRVEVRRERSRVYQVTEQHGEVAAFGLRRWQGAWKRCYTLRGSRIRLVQRLHHWCLEDCGRRYPGRARHRICVLRD